MNYSKEHRFIVSIITFFIFLLVASILGIMSINYKIRLNKQILETRLLEEKISDLELEIKSLHYNLVNAKSSTNKNIEKARPALERWIYRRSKISRSMSYEILDNISKSSYPLFLLALMKTESNFNPTAVSKAGAMGLGQIMPIHEKALIEAGILKEMRDIFDIPTAVKATEFVWKMKMSNANDDINKALSMYLGANSHNYVNNILKDYFQLNYLCKKPVVSKEIDTLVEKPPSKKKSLNKKYIYIVKSNDTLSKIARTAYGETNRDILDIIKTSNPGINNIEVIFVGQKIILPKIGIGGVYRTPNLINGREGG